jgi:ATP/ADP translocase
MKKTLFTSALLLATPFIAAAQQLQPIRNLIASIGLILNALIPIAIAATVLVFFFGLFKYVRGAGDAKGAADGKKIMIAGIISLVVMISVWGIVRLVQSAFGITDNSSIQPPSVPQLSV